LLVIAEARDTAARMPTDDVELVRRGYEALNSGDLEGALALFHPDVEVRMAKDGRTVLGLDFDESYRGVDGFIRFLARVGDALDDARWEPEEYIDAGENGVVVLIRMTARGRASGLKIDQPMAHLCRMRDGKLVAHETFWERANALRAAGLT
jgi:ketosteroid isomerase-like protein